MTAAAVSPSPGPSAAGRRFFIFLLWFGALATAAYWATWFGIDRRLLATADSASYYAFENAFPLADAWMGVTGVLAAVALQRGRQSALLWMLCAGSASLYLAGMDTLFDLENGIYLVRDNLGNVLTEAFINVGCLLGGAAILRFAWKHRQHFLSLPR
ncbi:MAG: hypothetical protein ACYDCL_02410 [Myxococcales bacterium]